MRFQHLRESSFRFGFAGASQASLKSQSPTEQTLGIHFREQLCTAPGLRGVAGEGLVFSTSDLSLLSGGYRRRMRGEEQRGMEKASLYSPEKKRGNGYTKKALFRAPEKREAATTKEGNSGTKPEDELGLVEAGMRQRRTFQRLCKMTHDTSIKVYGEHFFF